MGRKNNLPENDNTPKNNGVDNLPDKKGLKTYIVQGCNIRNGGIEYPINSEIKLTDEQAKKIPKIYIKLKGGN